MLAGPLRSALVAALEAEANLPERVEAPMLAPVTHKPNPWA